MLRYGRCSASLVIRTPGCSQAREQRTHQVPKAPDDICRQSDRFGQVGEAGRSGSGKEYRVSPPHQRSTDAALAVQLGLDVLAAKNVDDDHTLQLIEVVLKPAKKFEALTAAYNVASKLSPTNAAIWKGLFACHCRWAPACPGAVAAPACAPHHACLVGLNLHGYSLLGVVLA
jgi:hypothetical protein